MANKYKQQLILKKEMQKAKRHGAEVQLAGKRELREALEHEIIRLTSEARKAEAMEKLIEEMIAAEPD